MEDKSGYGLMSLLTAFTVGAAAGTAIALLTAPRRGNEMRENMRQIPKAVRQAYDKAAGAAREAFKEAYEEQVERYTSK